MCLILSRIGPYSLSYYKEPGKATMHRRQEDEGALPSKLIGGFKIELASLGIMPTGLSCSGRSRSHVEYDFALLIKLVFKFPHPRMRLLVPVVTVLRFFAPLKTTH